MEVALIYIKLQIRPTHPRRRQGLGYVYEFGCDRPNQSSC